MLVKSEQLADVVGVALVGEEQLETASVSGEDLVLDQLFHDSFGLALFGCFPVGQGIHLGEVVGHELVMLLSDELLLLFGVSEGSFGLRLGIPDELDGNHVGALVDQLEEGVLGVGSGFAEDQRAVGLGVSVLQLD